MKKTLLSLFLSGALCSFGQSVSPEVIATAGGHFTNATAQLSWTLGEPIIETVSDGSNQLTQGFHQTNLSWVSTFELNESIVFNVFPNPAINHLSIEVSQNDIGSTLRLTDVNGRLLLEQSIEELTTTLDFSSFAVGTYQLNLINEGQQILKTFTVQKIK